ncbi:MAG: SUMF1/EgtB/PvdO family nonheme iron enzyme [Candidatus Aminicenantes bacterium]|nr:SUMF1/EgtB/PvdO family nonheme iron enzyme [Candidatus Aminicenantes bacterium]
MNIRQAVPLLVERLRQQKVILFVGAGLSQGSGLPGWKKLFEPFCKKLDCPDEENFPAVATTLIQERIHNRKEIIEHIVKQIGAVTLELNPNHDLIKRLPFKIIITTNYDNLLEDLYGPSRLTRIYSDENMAYFDPHSAKKQLIYLHGDINHPDHMVVSSIDYQNFADTRPIMVERLKTLLQDYTFLFIGYSAGDPNLQAVFDHFRITYKENANRHFIVMADPGKVKQTELSTRFGIEPVILKDKTELTSFLHALSDAYENPDRATAPGQGEEAKVPGDGETGFVDDFIKARGQKKTGAPPSPTPMPLDFQPLKPFNVPGADPHFTGREKELEVLQKALLDKQTVAVTGLFGMGGIGKTSLAKQVAHQFHRDGYFKDGICWHRLEAKTLPVSLEEMADVFGAAWLKEIKPLETQARYFQAVIQDLDILFVLDNAEYLENIPPLLDLLRNHSILITSRRHLAGLAGVIDLHRLDGEQSMQLFIKTWKKKDREEEIKHIAAALSPQELVVLHSVCTGLLGNLPLAITIAASVLRYKKIDIIAFQKLLAEKQLSLLQDPNNVYKTEEKDRNVRLSFDFSFGLLPADGLEQSLFVVMGIFGGEDFSREALVEIFKEENKEAIDSGVEILEQLSMVQVRANQRFYLHPLLRQYALEKLPEFKGDAAYEAMAGYYLDLVKNNPQALHYEWKNALPFVDWCLAHSREKDGLFLIKKIDWFLYETGQWSGREEWLKKGIDIASRIEDVSELYSFTERMQDLYGRQGRLSEQKEVSHSLSNYCRGFKQLESYIPWINYTLAASFLDSHEIEKAYYANLKNMKDSLFYGQKTTIGASYQNLGNICWRTGLPRRALQFYRASLVIAEKLSTLKTNKTRAVGDVSDIYLDMGQWTEALEWLKRYESELAENPHKELEADLYEKYFFYYLGTGDTGKAQDYLDKYKETGTEFGKVTSSAKLFYYEGLLEKVGGHHEKAISIFEKALQFYRDIRREDETGKCFLNMGICSVRLGNTRKAREYLQAAGDIFKKYRNEPLLRCQQEAYYALLEARSAYDEQAVRLVTRAKNTYLHMGIENSRELHEIETDIRREIGEDRFNALLKQLKDSGHADETIDFGVDFLQVDPEQKKIVSPLDHREMALIPSGFFESSHYKYTLYLYPFYMDKYPVTNSDYKKFTDAMNMETPPHWLDGKIPPGMEDHPVVGITYDQALAYAQWAGKDLPLNEEWEIAAGISEQQEPGILEEERSLSHFISVRNKTALIKQEENELFSDASLKIKTSPVTQDKDNRNPFGLCDLLGNVFEYTQSFSTIFFGTTEYLILKGFSWQRHSYDKKDDITDGHYSFNYQRWADVGFRCVKRILRKEDAQRFITDGDKAKDWENQWWYDRAQHLFDILPSGNYYESVESVLAKGITCCQNLLDLSPGHKKAVYLLTRFSFHLDDLIKIKWFFDNTLYPLLAKEKDASTFNWNRLREILSSTTEREEAEDSNTITRHQKLEELTAKIDWLLEALEDNMLLADLRLTGRNTFESLEYLLNRYEEKLSFLQYTVILFLCLMKMKLNKEKESLEARAEISVELLTPTLEIGKESIVAVKVSSRGLAPVKDIYIELSAEKEPLQDEVKHLEIARRQFTIPFLAGGETLDLETAVTAHKTGTFPLYIIAGYTNPAAPEEEQETRQTTEASLEVTAPQPIPAADSTTGKAGIPGTAKQSYALDNPYYTGRPIQEPGMYFGRNDVLERIEQRLGPNNIIILYGQRRTGKTSTLFQLKNRVYKYTAVPVILDIQSMMGDDTSFLFYRMASDLYETMVRLDNTIPTHLPEPVTEEFKTNPQYKFELFLKKAINEVKEKPIIYLIDEFDGLFYMIKEKKVEPTVLDNLRSIMQHYQQVWFILAGTYKIKSEAADSKSALFNIATYEKIGALEEKDARALITHPLQGRVEYEPYAVDKIISLTNCNPYFIQAICFEMVYYLEARQLRRVTVKDLQVVVDKLFDRGSSHFDQFWTYLSKPECLMLSLLATNTREYENFISLDRVRDICKGWIDPKVDIYKIITQLQEKDFLTRREYLGKPHTGFFMELFKRWVLIHHPLESYELNDRG